MQPGTAPTVTVTAVRVSDPPAARRPAETQPPPLPAPHLHHMALLSEGRVEIRTYHDWARCRRAVTQRGPAVTVVHPGPGPGGL
jgi:hypothetical protein